ncbi:MAG TPA: protein kinase [Polyangiales bacterium]|nr:protein kinase [Polyangiales bacterium]
MGERATDSSRPPAQASSTGVPALIAGRYRGLAQLGRGGMATVYRVSDAANGNELALKQLDLATGERRHTAEALFETEFQTLTQLHHPRVIQVYDYGIADGRAYYTMELLDGGDLAEQSPLAWQTACQLIYEVCSSLALLHSRRLVHRDVSPRNIRRTRDGRPKLIDFGAMCSMGASHQPVGTPAFVAPEVVQRASLDGRTDLFSLGATLYYTLTGRPPFPARSFAQLHEAWSVKPPPVSSWKPEVPAALDDLVSSLISLEPALRPRSAFDVMQRLSAIAQIDSGEPLGVSHAYLATPTLIGRDELLAKLKRRAARAESGLGSALIIEGPAGSGRSRALDASVLMLKTSGITTLRAGSKRGEPRSFELAEELAQQLLESRPDVALAALQEESASELLLAAGSGTPRIALAPGTPRAQLNDALSRFFLRVARSQPLAITADDVDRADDASVAFLATLCQSARRHRLLVLTTAEQRAGEEPARLSLRVLAERSQALTLAPLTAAETEHLFDSVFGDVPHVAMIADRIYSVSLGNPKISMELAQHLVDRGVIVYDAGTWTLPETLDHAALPSSMDGALAQRVASLSELARFIAECHALSRYRELDREDHKQLAAGHSAEATAHALRELVEHQLLADEDGSYKLTQAVWAPVLLRELPEARLRERHAALAELGERTGKPVLPVVHHWLAAELHERGVERICAFLQQPENDIELVLRWQFTPAATCELLERAVYAAEAAGRSRWHCMELRRWLCMIGAHADPSYSLRVGPPLLAQLLRDSGHDDWRSLAAVADPGPRLTQALTAAAGRHAAAPEAERCYAVDVAIRQLVTFVAVSIAVYSRAALFDRLRALPELLEPFAPLSPVVDAIWHNAIATREASCEARFFQARERWLGVLERLENVQGDALRYVHEIRYSVIFALGLLEGARGFPTAEQWAKQLEREPRQRVAALYLRKVARMQLGDWEGAERFRREAELAALQSDAGQTLNASPIVELAAHAMASDLPGVRQVAARIATLADKYPGWRVQSSLASGYFELLRGNLQAARQTFESALAACTPNDQNPPRSITAWPASAGAYLQTLLGLGQAAEALEFGEHTLREAEQRGVHTMDDVVRGVALAQARMGDYAGACERLSALIERQHSLGVTGLHLGASYEARARAAIWCGDEEGVEKYGRMTAEQYRHGRGSPLGARYETLMSEARRGGVNVLPALSTFETQVIGLTELRGAPSSTFTMVSSALRSVADVELRNRRALELICQAYSAEGGQLYLLHGKQLARVASAGPHDAGDAQLDLARRCLDQAQHEDDIATELVSDASGFGNAAVLWTTQGSVEHRSLPISAIVEGELRHLGVVVLVAPASGPTPEAVATLSAVATLLSA